MKSWTFPQILVTILGAEPVFSSPLTWQVMRFPSSVLFIHRRHCDTARICKTCGWRPTSLGKPEETPDFSICNICIIQNIGQIMSFRLESWWFEASGHSCPPTSCFLGFTNSERFRASGCFSHLATVDAHSALIVKVQEKSGRVHQADPHVLGSGELNTVASHCKVFWQS